MFERAHIMKTKIQVQMRYVTGIIPTKHPLAFTSSDLLICFQRAINHYLEITLNQDMSKNVFWAQNAQIWLFGFRPPTKIENFDLFYFQWKGLTNMLAISRQPLPGDHFKSRYDKKVFWAQNDQISLFSPRSPTN